MMQKNEDALLRAWLEYHGFMFGFENLYIVDNGSTSMICHSILGEYRRRGVKVDYTSPTAADFVRKGEIVGGYIRLMQAQGAYDAVFPLDCDEFVVLKDGDGARADRGLILAHLKTLLEGGGLLRVDTQFFNVIGRPGEFSRQGYTKTVIVLDGTFLSSDQGHHYCEAAGERPYRDCDFAYVHYHYKPLELLRDHAREKLKPFVDVDDPAAISAFKGPGYHLRSYLMMTEAEYLSWHGEHSFYRFAEFNELMATLGITIPF